MAQKKARKNGGTKSAPKGRKTTAQKGGAGIPTNMAPIRVVLEKSGGAIANLLARNPVVGGAPLPGGPLNGGQASMNLQPKPDYIVKPKPSKSPKNGTF